MKESLENFCIRKNLQWILNEWDYKKNNIKPSELSYGSKVRVWWTCSLKHSWETAAGARPKFEYKCPYCSGQRIWPGFNDFATLHPEQMKEWVSELNKDSPDPNTIRVKNTYKAYWRCSLGHLWRASYASRSNNRGCRVCAGKEILQGVNDLESQKPELSKYLNSENSIKPNEIFSNGTKKYLWNCSTCNLVYSESPFRLSKYSHCKDCRKGRSVGELELYSFAKTLWEDLNNESTNIQSRWRFDMVSEESKVIVEYNGVYWHSDKVFIANRGETAFERHYRKKKEAEDLGYALLYVWEDDWEINNEKIKDSIKVFRKTGELDSCLSVLSKG